MNARAVALVIVLPAVLNLPSHAATPAAPSARSAWSTFLSSEGAGWDVQWDDSGVAPIRVRPRAGVSLRGWQGDHTGATTRFLAERKTLFGLGRSTDELQAVEERTHRGMVHVRVKQFYRGVHVLGGEYMVSTHEAGDLRLMLGAVHPGINVDVTPEISANEATAAALRECSQAADRYETETRLVIDPKPAGAQLIYEVRAQNKGFGESWTFLIDANNGRVVAKRDMRTSAIGCGEVHPVGPLDTLIVSSQTFPVTEINGGGEAKLYGPRVQYVDPPAPLTTDVFNVSSSCWDFTYPHDDHGGSFDRVNVYYHLDRYAGQYLSSLGFSGFAAPIRVGFNPSLGCNAYAVAGPVGYAGSVFMSSTCFVPRSSDVAYHEATHVLLNYLGISHIGEYSHEDWALHEGYSDYFACAANNDSIWSEVVCPQSSVVINGQELFFPGCRPIGRYPNHYNYANYPQYDLAVPHYGGLIISGALWNLHDRIGSVADQIAFESLLYLPTNPTFQLAGWALVQADYDHHGTAYRSQILQACASRGIPTEIPPTAAISGPDVIYRNQSSTFTPTTQFGTPPLSYHWTATKYFPGWSVESDLGTSSQVTLLPRRETAYNLKLRVTDAASHFVDVNKWVHVCSTNPPGEGPLTVGIVGGPLIGENTEGQFEFTGLLSNGACHDSLSYQWTMECHDVQCEPEVVGTGPTVIVGSDRDFDLTLLVHAGTIEEASTTITYHLPGMPNVSIHGPDELALEQIETYEAVVSGGDDPATYAWSWSPGFEWVIGTASTIAITGSDVPGTVTLCLSVTTDTGLHADIVCKSIEMTGGYSLQSGKKLSSLQVGSRGNHTIDLALDIPRESDVVVRAYDLAGRQVGTIYEGQLGKGKHQLAWPSDLRQPGVYFVRAMVGTERLTKRVAVIR